jgi:hypothetical protein
MPAQLLQRLLHLRVVEYRLLELFELAALLRREALEQRLHLGRLARDLLEELVQALNAGEHLAPAVHESLDVGLPAGGLLSEHAIQITEHLPKPVRSLGPHPLETLLQLSEQALRHLLAEPEHQLLELLPGLGIDELVVLETADGAAKILRQGVEGRTALGPDALELLTVTLRVRLVGFGGLARGVEAPVDAPPLGVEDVLELLPEVTQHVAEVVPVEERLALAAKPLEQLAKARHLLPVPIPEALAEKPLECAPEVPVGDKVVRHRRQEIVGVEVRK